MMTLLAQAFRMLELIARAKGALKPGESVVTVLLADLGRKVRTGGGSGNLKKKIKTFVVLFFVS